MLSGRPLDFIAYIMHAVANLFILGLVNALSFQVEAVCKDKNRQCGTWKNKGYCTLKNWSNYLKTRCPLSCGHCSGGGGRKSCGVSQVASPRIVGGANATRGAWPWMASITIDNTHWCGGSLISNKWVLTAAHCLMKYSQATLPRLRVKLGEHDLRIKEGSEQIFQIQRFLLHPKYDPKYYTFHDIALIELKTKVTRMNKYVQTLCLPSPQTAPSSNQTCYLAGWGSISVVWKAHHTLQQARLPVALNYFCGNQLHTICAGYGRKKLQNACGGDSGGPFFCYENSRWVQHGVTSYVTAYCKYYTAFTQVSHYLDWIRKYVPGV